MAKISRELLKGIVKECLVEILSEGLSTKTSSSGASLNEVTHKKPRRSKKQEPVRRKAADLVSFGETKNKQSDALNQRITAAAGGNSIMESILRDTAKNTLPTMLAADNRKDRGMAERLSRGDQATRAMADADPMSVFEGASNWAALAFAEKQKN